MNLRRQFGVDKRPPHIDMTPMVDTFLNLMIFFFLTASFAEEATRPSRLDVNLPKSPSAVSGKQAVREDLAIVIRRNGDIEVEGRIIDIATLEQRLIAHKRADPQSGVIIQADEKVTHGKVVHVMGLVDKLKIKRLSIGVEEQR